MSSFVDGGMPDSGSAWARRCAKKAVVQRGAMQRQPWPSSIHNRTRPPEKGARGYDAGKKIKGRKRHVAVDTQGNLLTVVVHSAGIQDRVGARAVLMRLFRRFDRLTKVFADGGYTGTLIDWAREMLGYDVEVVKRNELHTFKVLPKRWIVERNFAWMGWSRRLSKDYELRPTSSETMIWISFTHTLLRRT